MHDFFLSCRFTEKVTLNRHESPCDGDDISKEKKMSDIIARGYLHGVNQTGDGVGNWSLQSKRAMATTSLLIKVSCITLSLY